MNQTGVDSSFLKSFSDRKTLLTISILLLLLFFAYLASVWGIAELVAIKPRYFLSQWEQNKIEMELSQWQEAEDSLQFASRLNGSNPEYVLDLGRLYELRASEKPVWTEHAHRYRAQAITYFRDASRRRPVWAMAWVLLGLSKTLNQELDEETILALDKAMQFGPWEYGVQRRIIWLGFSIWDHLPEKTRQSLQYVIEESYKRRRLRRFIQGTAKYFKREAELQGIIKGIESKG